MLYVSCFLMFFNKQCVFKTHPYGTMCTSDPRFQLLCNGSELLHGVQPPHFFMHSLSDEHTDCLQLLASTNSPRTSLYMFSYELYGNFLGKHLQKENFRIAGYACI